MGEVDFSEHTVRRRWREVKGALREDLAVWTRHYLKRLLEHTLEEEREVYLRAARHERTPDRQFRKIPEHTHPVGSRSPSGRGIPSWSHSPTW